MKITTRILTANDRFKLRCVLLERADVSAMRDRATRGSEGWQRLSKTYAALGDTGLVITWRLMRAGIEDPECMSTPECLIWAFAVLCAAAPFWYFILKAITS